MEHLKMMEVSEFRRLGLLQELNRQFLHPLGLALEVIGPDGDTCRCGQPKGSEIHHKISRDAQIAFAAHDFELPAEAFGGVWDCRDDPEGIIFADPIGSAASRYVDELREQHRPARELLLGGSAVQPVTDA